MSLEFGLYITIFGVLAMLSSLVAIIIASELLKRRFRTSEITPSPVEEPPLEREGISEAAAIAAIMAYLVETPSTPRSSRLTRGVQPTSWNIAGREDLMELQIRKGR